MLNDDILIAQSSLWANLKLEGKSIKYNQMVSPNVSSHTSSVPSANQFASYITILSPSLVGHKVYAKITTSNPKIRLGWYITNNSGYDFVDGSALSTSSAVSNVYEGVYEITQDMVHTGTGYLQLYYWLYNGLPTGSHEITIQLVDLTELGMDNIINPVLFNATDLGKVMAHKTLSNGKGIFSLKAPYKCYDINDNEVAEINMWKRVDLGSLTNGYMSNDNFFVSGIDLGFTTPSTNNNGYEIVCDYYKRENSYDLYTKSKTGICLTSPYLGNNLIVSDPRFVGKTKYEVLAMLSGVYLYYETATPTELYGMKKASSLLGKQNVENQTITDTNYNFAPTTDGSFDYYNVPNNKRVNVKANHKYFFLGRFKENFTFTNFVFWGLWENSSNPIERQTPTIVGKDYFTILEITQDYNNAIPVYQIGTTTANNYVIQLGLLIDITELGLDTLTAQQFYDLYKDKFEKLANGQSTYLLCNTYENINGRSNVVLGAVDLGTIDFDIIDVAKHTFRGYFELAKPIDTNVVPNALCSKYTIKSNVDAQSGSYDKSISVGNDNPYVGIIVCDSAYNTAEDLEQAMSGVILIYELATPRTDYYLSRMIPKNVVKIIDDNGMEIDL